MREAERLLSVQKEGFFGVDKNLNGERSAFRAEKYQISLQTQNMMEKTVQRHQKELEDLNAVMSQKYERLQNYLKDRLNDKRISRDKLTDIKEELGVTVLMVEHDMSLVSRVSDRVFAMSQGQELASGTPREVQTNAAVIEAYLGTADDVTSLRRPAAQGST